MWRSYIFYLLLGVYLVYIDFYMLVILCKHQSLFFSSFIMTEQSHIACLSLESLAYFSPFFLYKKKLSRMHQIFILLRI